LIVVDGSVVATALGDDGADGRRARRRLVDEQLAAPGVIDLEVVSVWRRLCAAGHLQPGRAVQAIADLEALPLQRVPHRTLLRRCWELRDSITVCDAAYLALAERLDATLVTADRLLSTAPGARCTVELLA